MFESYVADILSPIEKFPAAQKRPLTQGQTEMWKIFFDNPHQILLSEDIPTCLPTHVRAFIEDARPYFRLEALRSELHDEYALIGYFPADRSGSKTEAVLLARWTGEPEGKLLTEPEIHIIVNEMRERETWYKSLRKFSITGILLGASLISFMTGFVTAFIFSAYPDAPNSLTGTALGGFMLMFALVYGFGQRSHSKEQIRECEEVFATKHPELARYLLRSTS